MARRTTDELNPATRVLWRGERCVQLELADRAVVLDSIPVDLVRALTSRGDPEPGRRPRRGGDRLADVRTQLVAGGFLWTRSGDPEDPRRHPPDPRLAGELTALTAQHGDRAASMLRARMAATVAIHGESRVGPHVAAILAASGVGRVYATSVTEARLHQLQPGGLGTADEGIPLATATAVAVERSAPYADATPLTAPSRPDPDLVIIARDEPVDDDHRDSLHARGWAHLPVSVTSAGSSVGPLVVPGMTSCLRCADLFRLDRDPAWTALAVQLANARRVRDSGSLTASSIIAGVAAAQALEFLDGPAAGQPATFEGSLELTPGDWRLRRRSRPVHPDCDCLNAAGQ